MRLNLTALSHITPFRTVQESYPYYLLNTFLQYSSKVRAGVRVKVKSLVYVEFPHQHVFEFQLLA